MIIIWSWYEKCARYLTGITRCASYCVSRDQGGGSMTQPNYRKVKDKVKQLREKYKLYDPPINPLHIARSEGINVKFVNFRNGLDISGFYDPSENTIYVNKNESPKRQTFTIAHELGHALLHRDWAQSEDYHVLKRDQTTGLFGLNEPHEKEANAFAAHLLVPRDLLDKYYPDLDVKALARLFAVSVPVIENRIEFEYGE